MSRFKSRSKDQKHFQEKEDQIDLFSYPVFCFKNVQQGFKPDDGESKDCSQLCQKLRIWSEMTWMSILSCDRKTHGHEIIPASALKVSVPAVAINERIISTRFGKNRLLGFKKRGVFHILWVDYKLETYNH